MASFFVVGMGVVGSRDTLQDHVGHRSVTTREAGRECALGCPCCHRLLLEHLLSANLFPDAATPHPPRALPARGRRFGPLGA